MKGKERMGKKDLRKGDEAEEERTKEGSEVDMK